jgi:tetratricopeptide (TPR) repeat protein
VCNEAGRVWVRACVCVGVWLCVIGSQSARTEAHQQTPPASTDAAIAEARKLIDGGNPSGAIERLQPLVSAQHDPETPADLRLAELLGVAYYQANDAAHAIEQLDRIVDRLPSDSPERREAVQVLGLSHYLAGHIREAIPYLEETRRAVPGDMKLAYALAMAYAQTRQPDKARESIARTFDLAPASASAHLLTGQMMNRLELEDLAEAELREALRLDPKLPEVHYLLAQIAIFRSRFDEGLALLQAELAINPAHAMALYRIGDVYVRQEKWTDAIRALQQSIWVNPYFSGPYILLGKAYSKTGQPGAAEEMLKHAVGYDPNNRSAHYLLAQVLQQAGKLEEAKREFAIAERLQGDSK